VSVAIFVSYFNQIVQYTAFPSVAPGFFAVWGSMGQSQDHGGRASGNRPGPLKDRVALQNIWFERVQGAVKGGLKRPP